MKNPTKIRECIQVNMSIIDRLGVFCEQSAFVQALRNLGEKLVVLALIITLSFAYEVDARQLLVDDSANETHTTDSGLTVYPLDEALKMAEAEGKKILMDVYAVWCPYCKKMHTEVYTDPTVQERIEELFYVVKVNAEGGDPVFYKGIEYTEETFARALNVTSYPSTFFMRADGEILGMQPGVMPADIFGYLLEYVGKDEFLEQSFDDFLPSDVKMNSQ